MPDAATHDRIAVITAPIIAIPAYVTLRALGDTTEAALYGTALLVGTHLVGSYMLSPDLDLDTKIDDRWGPFRFLWLPYMKLVPHRHWFSHSGISGIFRLLYLYAAISLVLIVITALLQLASLSTVNYYQLFSNWLWEAGRTHTRLAIIIVVGIVISDVVHVATDRIDTWRKRKPRRRKRRH